MSATCSICLEALKNPVAAPCGHVHCSKCLNGHINAGADACQSTCPTCRTPFSIAIPDLNFVPKKYHPFIIPSIRKVYLEVDPNAPNTAALEAKVKQLEQRIRGLETDKRLLMERAESNIAKANILAEKERDARERATKAENDRDIWKQNHDALLKKYNALKPNSNGRKSPSTGTPTHVELSVATGASISAAIAKSTKIAHHRPLSLQMCPGSSPALPVGQTRVIRSLPKRTRRDVHSIADELGREVEIPKRPRLTTRRSEAALSAEAVTNPTRDDGSSQGSLPTRVSHRVRRTPFPTPQSVEAY